MKGWLVWGKQLFQRMQTADTASYAAALAYNFLFALFPLLLFLAALLGLLHLPSVKNFFDGPVSALIAPNLKRLILRSTAEASRRRSPTLASLGAAGFIWAMSGSLRQLIDALNHAYEMVPARRKVWKTYLLSLGLGVFLGVLMLAAEALVTAGSNLIRWAYAAWFHNRPGFLLTEMLRWCVFLALLWSIPTLIYNWLPDRSDRFYWLSPGTLVVMGLWIVISLGFSFYSAHFNTYNLTYGSLGGVILLLLYLYILAFSLLLGGEINALWIKAHGSQR